VYFAPLIETKPRYHVEVSTYHLEGDELVFLTRYPLRWADDVPHLHAYAANLTEIALDDGVGGPNLDQLTSATPPS